ncbi:hypothetical protein E2C01_027238 [Portunus trituberculatus]|uniref:Uncharacterized protein n=1 Tax=Portunus trituberculatus TaxID=210409 RepID=A0A5B7EHD9_PORTR|nr:hypothetical protein [Portunus trituberculatus]
MLEVSARAEGSGVANLEVLCVAVETWRNLASNYFIVYCILTHTWTQDFRYKWCSLLGMPLS